MVLPVADLFDSAWFKWGRAKQHAEALNANIPGFAEHLEGHTFEIPGQIEYDPKRHCVILRATDVPTPPVVWGLMLGDVIGCLRSSLDHIAWAVVQRGKTPNLSSSRANRVYFPFTASDAEFSACLPTKLPGARRADTAIIRRYQPYSNGKRLMNRHVFTLLPKLVNDDKHRTVQPVFMLPAGVMYKILGYTDCEITRIPIRTPGEPLKIGTEMQRVYVRKTGPNPQVHMQADLTAHPALGKEIWLTNWMYAAVWHTGWLLREFADPPVELFSMGPAIPPLPWPDRNSTV
jgi:hypothetical protein